MNKKNSGGFIIPIVILIVAIVVAAYFFFSKDINQVLKSFSSKPSIQNSVKPIVIGFSLGSLQEERWQKDRTEWVNNVKTLSNVSLDLQTSNNDIKIQISQIEAMIAKGVNVLVVAPYDATSLTAVIDKAHKAGIKIISYDRLILNSNVDYYLSFDNEKVGELQAQGVVDSLKDKLSSGTKLKIVYVGGSTTDNNAKLLRQGSFKVLQPLIDSGKIEIVMDKFTPNWEPDTAYKNVKAYLDSSKGAVDGVVAANDGTAGGAIKALNEYKLGGKVPVSGQDAELSACQRVVNGTQTVTVYKSIPKLAAAGIDLAIKIANGEVIKSNAVVNDGKVDVPSVLLDPIAVTKANMDSTVIKDGYHSQSDVYKK